MDMPHLPAPRAFRAPRLTPVIAGDRLALGARSSSLHFRAAMFDGGMDPVRSVDHVVLSEPTAHPRVHTGVSAVTALFEDSQGALLNRDSLGNQFALEAGGVYLLAAAQGAVHEMAPAEGARVHALHLLVDLPPPLRRDPARAWRRAAADVPVIEDQGARIRFVLGRSDGSVGGMESPDGLLMLDGVLDSGAHYAHELPEGRQAWVYAITGEATLHASGESAALAGGQALCVSAGTRVSLAFAARSSLHFVLVAGSPVGA
jgi:redox-sensitive bicupin YhaK (pirin superfamily)